MSIEKAFSVKSIFVNYDICKLVGTVLDEKTRSETKVKGSISGGGGSVSSAYGGQISPVKGTIDSKTTTYQDIFLQDTDGGEHAIELKNFIVSCRPGNKLTFCGLYGGDVWFHAVNESTGKVYTNKEILSTHVYPVFIFIAIVIIAATVTYFTTESLFIGMVIGLVVAYIVGKTIKIIRQRSILKSIAENTSAT